VLIGLLSEKGEVGSNTSRTMTYLEGKPKEDNSMSLKRVSRKVCTAVWPASPVRKVKLGQNRKRKRHVEPKFCHGDGVARRSIPDATTPQ